MGKALCFWQNMFLRSLEGLCNSVFAGQCSKSNQPLCELRRRICAARGHWVLRPPHLRPPAPPLVTHCPRIDDSPPRNPPTPLQLCTKEIHNCSKVQNPPPYAADCTRPTGAHRKLYILLFEAPRRFFMFRVLTFFNCLNLSPLS